MLRLVVGSDINHVIVEKKDGKTEEKILSSSENVGECSKCRSGIKLLRLMFNCTMLFLHRASWKARKRTERSVGSNLAELELFSHLPSPLNMQLLMPSGRY